MTKREAPTWRRREKAVHEVRAGDRLRFGAAVALKLGPDPSKGKQDLVILSARDTRPVLVAAAGCFLPCLGRWLPLLPFRNARLTVRVPGFGTFWPARLRCAIAPTFPVAATSGSKRPFTRDAGDRWVRSPLSRGDARRGQRRDDPQSIMTLLARFERLTLSMHLHHPMREETGWLPPPVNCPPQAT
jgi:hypothetical protein